MTATVKAYKGMGMEGGIARWYDKTTRKDMDEFRKLAALDDRANSLPGPGMAACCALPNGSPYDTA